MSVSNVFEFAGIEINNLSFDQVLDIVEKMIKNNQKGYIVTPNASHIVYFQKDYEFRNAYTSATLRLADGMSIVFISYILGKKKIIQRITGMDLLMLLCNLSANKDYRIYLLGGTIDTLQKVKLILEEKFPDIKIVGYHEGYFEDDNSIIEKINLVKPDILFIGMGFPKQEKWIWKNIKYLDIKIAICVGGVFDVISGKVKRAPEYIQKIGLEWLWRLIQEPRRLWKRYLICNTFFIFLVIKELIGKLLRKNYD